MILGGLFAVLAVAVAIYLAVGFRPGGQQKYSHRWIAEQNAPISGRIASEVENARWHIRTGLSLGALAGIVIIIPGVAAFDSSNDASVAVNMALFLVPTMSMAIGSAVGGFVAVFPDVRGPVRVASSHAVKLTDSVNRFGLAAMRVQMGLLLVGGLAATQYPAWTGNAFGAVQHALLWVAIIVPAALWAATEIVARQLVAAPQPSTDAVTLFWREALRGELLRQICRLPAATGYLAPLLITETLPRSYGTPAAGTGPSITFTLSMMILGLSVLAQILLTLEPTSRRRTALQREAQLESA